MTVEPDIGERIANQIAGDAKAKQPTGTHIHNALRQAAFELGLPPNNAKLRAILETAADYIAANINLDGAVPWLPAGDHYVLVAERDTTEPVSYEWDALGIPHPTNPKYPPGGPITWEHYLGEHTARDVIAERIRSMGGAYGRKAIAKLVFVRADL